MKLPDFWSNAELNFLKVKMGLNENILARFSPGIIDLSLEEEEAIKSGNGIDVDAENINLESDGTFSYKGIRVVIHIRDVANYGHDEIELPKYHLIQCDVISSMKTNGRFHRYVVNAEPEGKFKIKRIHNNVPKFSFENLRVCQKCLSEKGFWGFSFGQSKEVREKIVSDFKPKDFFEAYPMTLFNELPIYDVESYPTNIYSKDFPQIAERVKRIRNYTCEECGVWLKDAKFKQYLHAHHKNSQKSDNRFQNLKVLCIECHARYHSHMKNDKLSEYKKIWPRPPISPYWNL